MGLLIVFILSPLAGFVPGTLIFLFLLWIIDKIRGV